MHHISRTIDTRPPTTSRPHPSISVLLWRPWWGPPDNSSLISPRHVNALAIPGYSPGLWQIWGPGKWYLNPGVCNQEWHSTANLRLKEFQTLHLVLTLVSYLLLEREHIEYIKHTVSHPYHHTLAPSAVEVTCNHASYTVFIVFVEPEDGESGDQV